jgi:hypothetical protein
MRCRGFERQVGLGMSRRKLGLKQTDAVEPKIRRNLHLVLLLEDSALAKSSIAWSIREHFNDLSEEGLWDDIINSLDLITTCI